MAVGAAIVAGAQALRIGRGLFGGGGDRVNWNETPTAALEEWARQNTTESIGWVRAVAQGRGRGPEPNNPRAGTNRWDWTAGQQQLAQRLLADREAAAPTAPQPSTRPNFLDIIVGAADRGAAAAEAEFNTRLALGAGQAAAAAEAREREAAILGANTGTLVIVGLAVAAIIILLRR